jgi:hypothetical protein
LLYGLATSGYYEYTRRKYKLPLWQDVRPEVASKAKPALAAKSKRRR